MYIPDSYLDELIASDIPSGIDLTTHVLGIGAQSGRMEYYTRDAALLCGTEEAARIFGRFGCTVVEALPNGSMLAVSYTHLSGRRMQEMKLKSPFRA